MPLTRTALHGAGPAACSQAQRYGDLATVGVSGPVPMGFVVRRVEESTPVSQQLQHPLRGYASDPRYWKIFFEHTTQQPDRRIDAVRGE